LSGIPMIEKQIEDYSYCRFNIYKDDEEAFMKLTEKINSS
jgi:hypothetical protein